MANLNTLPRGVMRCEYNGYEFGPTAETIGFAVRPQLDPAGRTVSHATYTITVRENINQGSVDATDAHVQNASARLSRNGGNLFYLGRGFGDIRVNIGKVKDVKWGPVTKEISCKCVGGGLTTELTWTVEFNYPNCEDASFTGI